MKGRLAKDYFQDKDKGLSCEGLLPMMRTRDVRLRLELRYI